MRQPCRLYLSMPRRTNGSSLRASLKRPRMLNFHLGGGPSIIPPGSGPRDRIMQAMLQETRQNPMTTPLRATGARWRILRSFRGHFGIIPKIFFKYFQIFFYPFLGYFYHHISSYFSHFFSNMSHHIFTKKLRRNCAI